MDFRVDALIIDNPSDVFYLTGFSASVARLVVEADGAKLIVDGRYFAAAKKEVTCDVVLAEKDALDLALKNKQRIGFDSFFVTVDQFNKLAKNKEWIPILKPIKNLRLCKDAEEIALLKEAANITKKGYEHIKMKCKEGVQEFELGLEFEIFSRKHGAEKSSFDPIVAFGENSAFPHYRAGKVSLKKNQIVLFDLGAIFSHYAGDMTRVFFFGDVDPELKRFEKLVKEGHDLAVEHARIGVKVGELDKIVREFFAKEGVDKLFSHTLGHGVGIDVHEFPRLSMTHEDAGVPLQEGMVFTIEPGLYLPGLGGVRHENTFVVTQKGLENFYD